MGADHVGKARHTPVVAGRDRRSSGNRAADDAEDRPRRHRITPQPIADTLCDAFGERQVNTIFGELNQRRVILEATPSYQEDASSLEPSTHRGAGFINSRIIVSL